MQIRNKSREIDLRGGGNGGASEGDGKKAGHLSDDVTFGAGPAFIPPPA